MGARRRLLGESWLQMGLVVLIVLLANAFAAGRFVRVDLTSERLYSLDEASKGIIGRLQKPLVVRVYFTPGLEAPYNNHEQFIRDKLDEFRAYSGGRMTVTVVDPARFPEAADEARRYGIQQLEYTVREQDRSELRKIWMGALLLHGERYEALPSLASLSSFEYDFASAVHRLAQKRDQRKTIGWTTGHGEPDWSADRGPLRALGETLSRKFDLRQVPLGGAGGVPEDVDALFLFGPQRALAERALYQIDQFLARGGTAGIFLTTTRPDMRSLRTQRVVSGMGPLLGQYGLTLSQSIVVDRVQNGAMRFPVRSGGQVAWRDVNFPLIPKATELSPDSVLTSSLDSLLFPFASPVTPAETLPDGVRAEVLAWSGSASGLVDSVRSLDPSGFSDVLAGETRGPHALLVALTGPVRSFFETRPVPRPVDGMAAADDAEVPEERPTLVEGAPTRIVVGGSADFIANNPAFMLNLADWLVQDEALIGIRSKIATLPALPSTTVNEQRAWKAFQLLFGPVLLFAYGGLRQLRRRRRAA